MGPGPFPQFKYRQIFRVGQTALLGCDTGGKDQGRSLSSVQLQSYIQSWLHSHIGRIHMGPRSQPGHCPHCNYSLICKVCTMLIEVPTFLFVWKIIAFIIRANTLSKVAQIGSRGKWCLEHSISMTKPKFALTSHLMVQPDIFMRKCISKEKDSCVHQLSYATLVSYNVIVGAVL